MKKLLFFFASLIIFNQWVVAQSITLTPNPPASPTKGTMVFDNVTNQLKYWNGSAWVSLTGGGGVGSWATNGADIYNTNIGNVGIGINTPKATFNVANGKTVLFGADSSGAGNKLIWYPSKGAFRAGSTVSNEWDNTNIGFYSTALGVNTTASGVSSTALGTSTIASALSSTALGHITTAEGNYSTALGYRTTASNNYSTAIGFFANASGLNSMAIGNNTTANNNYSTAIGNYTTASGLYSTAIGSGTTASGNYSTTMGSATQASGPISTAMGFGTTASGDYSTALGYFTTAGNAYSTAIGLYNVTVPNALFMVGNGNSNSLSNVMTVMSNGNVGIGTTSPIAPLHIKSSNSVNETNTRYFSYGTAGTIGILPNGTYNVGLLVDYDIVTKNSFVSAQTATTSDARIKNILGVSDNQQDLETLRRLQVTDYRYKDIANWGNQTFKKVIAQQVEEVYPQAVRKQISTIPDIYCLAEKVAYDEFRQELTVTLTKDYGIKVGDKLDMVHAEKGKIQAEVIAVSDTRFTVKDWLYPTDKIFVYGREVNDFRVVDYEALSMLGISAIQQLAKENEELVKEIKSLKANGQLLNIRLEAIEALLSKSQIGK